MSGKFMRAAIVGASSLLGKELADELNAATSVAWDLKLLDAAVAIAGELGGQITAAGDEAILIETLEPGSFTGMDVVFFTHDPKTTQRHWKEAVAAGASVVDCTGALGAEPGALVRAPWLGGKQTPDLGTQIVLPAHPAAVMLALVTSRLQAKWTAVRAAATVLEPASQAGSAGLDEMHQQTVALLSFQAVPKDVYDTQVAFNMNAALGALSKANLDEVAAQVRRDMVAVAGEPGADSLTTQWLQAPVFHGYTASIFVELGVQAAVADVASALSGGIISVPTGDEAKPSNLSATEESKVLVSVRESPGKVPGFWLWVAADNLKLAAQNAAACAEELAALRPAGKVQ